MAAPEFPHRQSNAAPAAFLKSHVRSEQRLSLTLCGLFLAGAKPSGRFKGYRAPTVISAATLRALDTSSACQACLHRLGRS